MVVDGGPCCVGVESTVVDARGEVRRSCCGKAAVTQEMLRAAMGGEPAEPTHGLAGLLIRRIAGDAPPALRAGVPRGRSVRAGRGPRGRSRAGG